MRTRTLLMLFALPIVALAWSGARATSLDGSVTLGGTIVNQTGDRSVVQEMGDVHDGFTVSALKLSGLLDHGNSLFLDLRDVNLDSRQGELVYRVPGLLRLSGSLAQHERIFSADGAVHSLRRDWRAGAELTPSPWLRLSGAFDYLTHDGDRLAWPAGTLEALGTRYDDALRSGAITADVHRGRRGVAVTVQASSYTDDAMAEAERTGRVVSARLYSPCAFYDRLTHFVNASYGVRRLEDDELEWRFYSFGYTGVAEPVQALRLRYQFQAERVDDESRDLRTERFVNAADATWYHRLGQFDGGFAYETNDDERALTSYQSWHAGVIVRPDPRVDARVEYAGRVRQDLGDLTLLKDAELSRLRTRLELRPVKPLVVGATFARRERELTGLGVDLKGDVVTAYGRWDAAPWGALSANYEQSADDCHDRSGGFRLLGRIVTARAETDRIRHLHLGAGLSWLDYKHDFDVEKSIVTAEGKWQITPHYHLAAAYNAFNFDDAVLLDRYFTANVLRLGFGCDLHVQ
jgi:hypothetical protein